MNRTKRRAVALASAVAFLSGCFTYIPADPGAVPAGAQIRVHLTPTGQVQMTQRFGRRIEDTLDGTLTGRQQNEFTLKVPLAAQQEGFFRSDISRDVQVAQPDVLGIDVRQFSRGRTALLVGGAAAGAAALVLTIVAAAGPSGATPPDGIEEIRIPLASFRIP